MFRIDSPGATGSFEFTNGNPSLSIAATVVSDEWLNAVQREIVKVIEGQGIVLDKGDDTQLEQALLLMIGLGGSQLKVDVANNVGPVDVTGLIFDKANFKAVRASFDLFRRTDSSNVTEMGDLFMSHNPESDTWAISAPSSFGDAGVTFNILASGQVQITSDDLTGAAYAGTLRVTSIVKFNQ